MSVQLKLFKLRRQLMWYLYMEPNRFEMSHIQSLPSPLSFGCKGFDCRRISTCGIHTHTYIYTCVYVCDIHVYTIYMLQLHADIWLNNWLWIRFKSSGLYTLNYFILLLTYFILLLTYFILLLACLPIQSVSFQWPHISRAESFDALEFP